MSAAASNPDAPAIEAETDVLWLVLHRNRSIDRRGRVTYWLDGGDVACLLELGAAIAAQSTAPVKVYDRLSHLLGWRWGADEPSGNVPVPIVHLDGP